LKKQLLLSILFFISITICTAQNSYGENLARSTTGIAGSSETISSGNQIYIVQQSIGQASVIGTFYGNTSVFRQGFIQPNSNRQDILPFNPLPLKLSLSIYPNPFAESVTLSFSEQVEGTIGVLVFDIAGRLVFSKNYQAEQKLKVHFDKLSMANYIIRVTANNKHFAEKLVKKSN
jgi:hypothetical protein